MKQNAPDTNAPTSGAVYVSITGLRLKSFVHYPVFVWLALTSMIQARRSPGLLLADARVIDGVHHTMTIWESEAMMRQFLVRGAHLKAMKKFGSLATGKTIGFLTEKPPSWSQAQSIWLHDAHDVGKSDTGA